MKFLLNIILLPVKIISFFIKTILKLAVFIIELMGRGIAFILGLILITLGVILSMTGIGAIIGVPLSIIGTILIFKIAF